MSAALGPDHKRLRRIWRGMHERCSSVATDSYQYYGGRGISVCDAWTEFEPFKAWALANGYAAHLTIERRDGARDYDPGNCAWATVLEQNRNRRGVHMSPSGMPWSEVARQNGIKPKTFATRISRGMTPEQAATTSCFFRAISQEASDWCDEAVLTLRHASKDVAAGDKRGAETLAKIVDQIEGWKRVRTISLGDDGKAHLAVAS